MEHRVSVGAGSADLTGDLLLPEAARAVVVFAHGAGSGRGSPRNRLVAASLIDAGVGALLIDLLTPEEDAVDARTREFRFDIDLLAKRVAAAVDWLDRHRSTAGLPLGCFGASTGAGAALVAAAARPGRVRAVVSRGGRPDLAGDALALVEAPTLLIVGGEDPSVIQLNREAMRELRGRKEVEIVPGAGHLFEEPGALEQVAGFARDWFLRHLPESNGAAGSTGG